MTLPKRTSATAQEQIDTRAIEIASHANAKCDERFGLIREELGTMREERKSQHLSAEAKFRSINNAMWTAATGLIGLLAAWLFYMATHQH